MLTVWIQILLLSYEKINIEILIEKIEIVRLKKRIPSTLILTVSQ